MVTETRLSDTRRILVTGLDRISGLRFIRGDRMASLKEHITCFFLPTISFGHNYFAIVLQLF